MVNSAGADQVNPFLECACFPCEHQAWTVEAESRWGELLVMCRCRKHPTAHNQLANKAIHSGLLCSAAVMMPASKKGIMPGSATTACCRFRVLTLGATGSWMLVRFHPIVPALLSHFREAGPSLGRLCHPERMMPGPSPRPLRGPCPPGNAPALSRCGWR